MTPARTSLVLGLFLAGTSTLASAQGWAPTGSLGGARYNHSATLLGDGRVLVAGGEAGSTLASVELYDPSTGAWTPTGAMGQARAAATAIRLRNGRVLVAGGLVAGAAVRTAETYDPASGTWSAIDSLNAPRYRHTATLLDDGRVLVIGGANDAGALASAEIYDPATGVWTLTGSLTIARVAHTASRLPDGRVVAAGGIGTAELATLEIYDPQSGSWSPAPGGLSRPRSAHTATLLYDGRILIAGGQTSGASAELYAPAAGTTTPTGPLLSEHAHHSATLLPNGRVLVAGSALPGAERSAEVYDPVADTWTPAGVLGVNRALHTATLLVDGRVLVAGGSLAASAEIFSHAAPAWVAANPLPLAVDGHTATRLADGRVVVAGGRAGTEQTRDIQVYAPSTGLWMPAAASTGFRPREHTATLLADGTVLLIGSITDPEPGARAFIYDPNGASHYTGGRFGTRRYGHTATLLRDGRVLVAGGACAASSGVGFCDAGGGPVAALAAADIYEPAEDSVRAAGALHVPRYLHTATLLRDGRVLVAGHGNGNAISVPASSTSVEIFDPVTGYWTLAGDLSASRAGATATLLPDGRVLIAGGASGALSTPLATAEIYDPATESSILVGDLADARWRHTATLLDDGRVLVTGGVGSAGALGTTEVFDPATGAWTPGSPLAVARALHTATLLDDGRVLVTGGAAPDSLASVEIYDRGLGFADAWRPRVTELPATLARGTPLAIGGTGFTGLSEASGGTTFSSSGGSPLVQVRHVGSGQVQWLPVGAGGWSATAFTSTADALADFPRGTLQITVFANGIPSVSRSLVLKTPTTLTLHPPAAIYAGVPTSIPFHVSAETRDLPGGSVTIATADGSSGCTALVIAGQCQLTLGTIGVQTLTATYSGASGFLPSTDVEVVQGLGGGVQTWTEIGEISPWPPMAGEPVSVSASVGNCIWLPFPPRCFDISGSVTISDESDPSTTCTTPAPSSTRQCTLVFHTAGEHTLRAVYAGSGAFAASYDRLPLTVGPRVFTLADGVTGPFFDTYLLLANPGATPEPVTMTLFRDDGTAVDLSIVVPPHERATVKTDDLPTFGESAFSAKVTVPSGRPLFVERATYFANDYRAGHAAMGRAPSARAYFAEGCQNSLFDTYLLVGNQATGTAHVLVSFLIDGGEPVNKTYAVPAGVRLSISAAGIPELAGRSFGIDIVSDRPVAVERSMYFGQGYVGGHSEVGVPRPSTTWLFAEGATGPMFDTFLLLLNPYSEAASATLRFHTSDGRTVMVARNVPGGGRVTIDVERENPALADTTFWIEVASDQPVVAERAMYWSSGPGAAWTDGHVSAGATAPGPGWGFAEGILGGGLDFKTFLLLANPGTSPAIVDVQYLPTGGGPITQVYTVPAGGRLTINVEAEVPALRDVPFGTLVTARAGGAVVAERSIYWTHNGAFFIGGTNTMGLGF